MAQLIWNDDAIDLIGFRFQQTSKTHPESVLIVSISVDLAVEQVTAIDAHVLSMKDDEIEISETLIFPTVSERRSNRAVLSQANPNEKGMTLTTTKYEGSDVEIIARNQQMDLPDDMAKVLGCNPCSSLGTQFMGNPKEVTNCVTQICYRNSQGVRMWFCQYDKITVFATARIWHGCAGISGCQPTCCYDESRNKISETLLMKNGPGGSWIKGC